LKDDLSVHLTLALCGIALFLPSVTMAQDTTAFPPVNRPVSPVIPPSWESEATRDRNHEADQVFQWLGVQAGDRVADVETGGGYYAVRLAQRLGTASILYAEDSEAGYLGQLRVRLEHERLPFIQLVLGDANDPKLPPHTIDVVILAYRYHGIRNPYEFFYHLFDALASGARIGVVELERPTDRQGTPAALMRCELAGLGYRQTQFTFLTPGTGYLAIFTAPDELPAIGAIRPCSE
jgi:hypothetical protein